MAHTRVSFGVPVFAVSEAASVPASADAAAVSWLLAAYFHHGQCSFFHNFSSSLSDSLKFKIHIFHNAVNAFVYDLFTFLSRTDGCVSHDRVRCLFIKRYITDYIGEVGV